MSPCLSSSWPSSSPSCLKQPIEQRTEAQSQTKVGWPLWEHPMLGAGGMGKKILNLTWAGKAGKLKTSPHPLCSWKWPNGKEPSSKEPSFWYELDKAPGYPLYYPNSHSWPHKWSNELVLSPLNNRNKTLITDPRIQFSGSLRPRTLAHPPLQPAYSLSLKGLLEERLASG